MLVLQICICRAAQPDDSDPPFPVKVLKVQTYREDADPVALSGDHSGVWSCLPVIVAHLFCTCHLWGVIIYLILIFYFRNIHPQCLYTVEAFKPLILRGMTVYSI